MRLHYTQSSSSLGFKRLAKNNQSALLPPSDAVFRLATWQVMTADWAVCMVFAPDTGTGSGSSPSLAGIHHIQHDQIKSTPAQNAPWHGAGRREGRASPESHALQSATFGNKDRNTFVITTIQQVRICPRCHAPFSALRARVAVGAFQGPVIAPARCGTPRNRSVRASRNALRIRIGLQPCVCPIRQCLFERAPWSVRYKCRSLLSVFSHLAFDKTIGDSTCAKHELRDCFL